MAADDRERFHGLDDDFHRMLCDIAGQGFAWSLIRENKAHMDRVRFISLAFSAEQALADHRLILAALAAGDAAGRRGGDARPPRAHLRRSSRVISAEHAGYVLRRPEPRLAG